MPERHKLWSETNNKKKKVRDLYCGISEFRKSSWPISDTVKARGVKWLQVSTVFWIGGDTISFSYWRYIWFSNVKQTEIHTAEPLEAQSSTFEFDIAIGKQKKVQVMKYWSNSSQWLTQEFCPEVGGGVVQKIQLMTEDRENGHLGAVSPNPGVLEAAVIWYKKFHFIY